MGGPSPQRIGRKGAKIINDSHTASAATKLIKESSDGNGIGYGDGSGFMTLDDHNPTERESR